MRIVFNKTGTHVKKYLKIRLDLIPEPGDKTYGLHHVLVPVIPEGGYPGKVDKLGHPVDQKAYDLWLESLPKAWQTNPCLSHFVKVDGDITREGLDIIVGDIFGSDTLRELDDCLTIESSASQVAQIMKGSKCGTGEPVGIVDVSEINARLEVIRGH